MIRSVFSGIALGLVVLPGVSGCATAVSTVGAVASVGISTAGAVGSVAVSAVGAVASTTVSAGSAVVHAVP